MGAELLIKTIINVFGITTQDVQAMIVDFKAFSARMERIENKLDTILSKLSEDKTNG